MYIKNHGPLNESYVNKVHQVLDKALMCHHRTLAIRVDLHLPQIDPTTGIIEMSELAKTDPAVISRFIDSFKAKIKAHLNKIFNDGKRVYPCTLRYIWAMEYGDESQNIHYHTVLFLNKDTFAYPGNYKKDEGTLAAMIKQAWHSALGLPYPDFKSLIYFPENCYYHLDYQKAFSDNPLENIIYRASYLTKLKSKYISQHRRSFGYSLN